ncbi:MAG: hypothetical protein AVDCRST_MAG49-6 [uncultured Thermomicrobiales bacterium]|uniref:3-oxoacyl-[acyl-carrier-protein] reductase n=1 Tax=uncultured Thermomicrobiales bacterium TaxID=1645740 RepID=A0A6J4TVG7_9BACT|nr:MAG: hypothetical protein AVDCRST_MAG49-6 [uncultured Thermomicrobiales bacterium]
MPSPNRRVPGSAPSQAPAARDVAYGRSGLGDAAPADECRAACRTGNTPPRRAGTPEDVADVVGLLVTERARWVTGQVIYVGGGHRMV